MMSGYRQRLYTDIYETLKANGPMTAGQVARTLQPKYSNCRLSSCRMARFIYMMGDRIEKVGEDHDRALYRAVAE